MSATRHLDPGALEGTRILLIEDQSEYRDLMRTVFESAGAVVAEAEDAFEALSVIDTVRPTVIVSDIGLPGMSGYELMKKIRSLTDSFGAHAYAVAVTSLMQPADLKAAHDAGFDAHVSKPFDSARLLDVVAGSRKKKN